MFIYHFSLTNPCAFNHLHRFSINIKHVATDLHLSPQLTKIGFPGWPEPILDSVTGLGASIMKKGACTGPLFRFWDRSYAPSPVAGKNELGQPCG